MPGGADAGSRLSKAVSGPSETTKLTADPGATLAPAPGFWLITTPAATVALNCGVTPEISPAEAMDAVAAD